MDSEILVRNVLCAVGDWYGVKFEEADVPKVMAATHGRTLENTDRVVSGIADVVDSILRQRAAH